MRIRIDDDEDIVMIVKERIRIDGDEYNNDCEENDDEDKD